MLRRLLLLLTLLRLLPVRRLLLSLLGLSVRLLLLLRRLLLGLLGLLLVLRRRLLLVLRLRRLPLPLPGPLAMLLPETLLLGGGLPAVRLPILPLLRVRGLAAVRGLRRPRPRRRPNRRGAGTASEVATTRIGRVCVRRMVEPASQDTPTFMG